MGTLRIETTLLDSFVGHDTLVYVKLGDGWVKKRAEDLQKGDLVLVQNEGITKTLKDVEPVLNESVRYNAAKHVLHEVNQAGQFIPRLRTFLLRGLTREQSSPDLETRILLENADFSDQEYSLFTDAVCRVIDGVGSAAVTKWLKGETLAPRDWQNVERLCRINTEFMPVFKSHNQPAGFHAAYELYVGLRRVIMGYLAKRSGSSGTETEEREKTGQRGVYTPEIELVVGRFISEVDREQSFARVTRIRPMNDERHSAREPHPEPRLHRGIVNIHPEKALPCQKEVAMGEIVQREYILKHALYDAINKNVIPRARATNDASEAFAWLAPFPTYLFCRFVRISNAERVIYETNLKDYTTLISRLEGKEIRRQEVEERLSAMFEIFMRDLGNGVVDAQLGMAEHTVAHLIDLVSQYRSALPKSYFTQSDLVTRMKLLAVRMKDKPSRETQKEYKQLAVQERQLGIHLKRYYGDMSVRKYFLLPYVCNKLIINLLNRQDRLSQEKLALYRARFETEGMCFLNRREVRLFLESAGVPDAIKLYEPDTFTPAAARITHDPSGLF